jgi:pimeloyl-ACP methyl ester carboxylesterase
MSEIRHRQVQTNGIGMHLAETGPADGPVVLCCHGFPESWYSWRHQLDALGDSGYHVIAPDMRGYGGTDATPIGTATMLHHLGDMVGVLDAVGAPSASIVGHDWGGPVAWTCAQLRPDRFPAVVSLGVPFLRRGEVAPTAGMRAVFADTWFYYLYFQEPGVAEAELEANLDTFLRGFFFTLSGDSGGEVLAGLAGGPANSRLLEHLTQPDPVPSWLSEDDVRFYVGEFERTGLAGGLNWYRSSDATWELTSGFADLKVHQPALLVYGEREPVLAMAPDGLATTPVDVPGLVDMIELPGCGHWTQQERPHEVNAALVTFLSRNT